MMIKVYVYASYEDLRHLQVEASVFIHSRAFNHHNFHHLCSSYSSRSSLAYVAKVVATLFRTTTRKITTRTIHGRNTEISGPCRYFSQEKQVSRLHANY
uniref:Uncharacterized protein n=2 Tax=Helianthus annuus TaxID=4232 RepID=A0A251T6J8_HELAN